MRVTHFALTFLLLLFVFTGLYSQTVDEDYFDGEIYVKYNDDFAIDFSQEYVEPQSLTGLTDGLIKEFGITEARFSFNKIPDTKLQRTVRIKFTNIGDVEVLLRHFEQLPYIEYAEKIPIVRPTYTPNDFGQNKAGDIWHLYKLNAQKAWDYTKGDTTITVAVVDQEVDINHPDLKDNIWTNPNEIPNNGIDDDANGYIDDIHGWDISDNDNDPTNYNNSLLNHGTPCSGLVSASTDNGLGISAIGFNVKLIAVKSSPDNLAVTKSIPNAYEGILYAALVKANIISCSFGGNSPSTTVQNIVNFASDQGCLIVASAGNDNHSSLHYPAAYSGVISVAASDINDKKAWFSNYGNWIDVSAPGVDVLTLNKDNDYKNFGGTSAACPITAGLLGLMKSYMPTASSSDLKQCLISTTDNIDHLNPSYIGQLGSGRINAEKALKCVDSLRTAPPVITVNINKDYICPLEKIELNIDSYRRPLDSATWYIYKQGKTEVLRGLKVESSFETDSIFSISCVGYDKYGKDSAFLNQFIHVNSLYNNILYFEDFESSNQNYTIINPDNQLTWERATAQKTNNSSNSALKVDFYESTNLGQRDAFVLPPMNLQTAIKPKLTFQYAYPADQFNSDSLIIYVSSDSGKTFLNRVFTENLPDIYTASSHYWSFKPDDNTEWCINHWFNRCKTIDLTAYSGLKNVVLKFEAYYGGGNNLYIDDIKVFTGCGDFITHKPISSFTSSNSSVCQGKSLQFAATSTSFPKTYQWFFEGAIQDTAYEANPKVYYPDTGTFDVTLITSNVLGSDTLLLKDYITVVPPPTVAVSDTIKYVCGNDSVYFSASGTDSIVWYNHNTQQFHYGKILGDKPVQHTEYSAWAISKEGCIDSIRARAVKAPFPPNVNLNKRLDTLEAVHNQGDFTYHWFINDTLDTSHTKRAIKPVKSGNYKVEIIDSLGCTRISPALYFEFIPDNVGINELVNSGIKIYPNPANSQLTIESNDLSPIAVSVFDALGKKVLQDNLTTGSHTINIASWAKGIYLVVLNQNGVSYTQKLIVK